MATAMGLIILPYRGRAEICWRMGCDLQRRNDINAQIREVARSLMPEAIDEAARYCALQRPEIAKAVE
jgi:hypothetical protein